MRHRNLHGAIEKSLVQTTTTSVNCNVTAGSVGFKGKIIRGKITIQASKIIRKDSCSKHGLSFRRQRGDASTQGAMWKLRMRVF